ncbi:MAG: hypothetical protein ACI9EW_000469 [Cellvibrionaceae bacterium]|jgi:hypothetical protein
MTVIIDEFSGRKRTAWIIVLLAFSVFVVTAISVPILVSSWLRRSMRPLISIAVSNQGTLALVLAAGETSAILETEAGELLVSGDSLITRDADSGTLIINHPDTEELLLRAQLYSNTDLLLKQALTPRFSVSSMPDRVMLQLNEGRMRLTIPDKKDEVVYEVTVPQGRVIMSSPGQYAIHVSDAESQVSILEGMATLMSESDNGLRLTAGQRGKLTAATKPSGPLATAENLIKNSSFNQQLDFWTSKDWIVELADQPMGETKIETFTGENSLRFVRPGAGHAETSVRQILNQDVTDYELLELIITLRIQGQSLWVCGTVGSECPLTFRLEYEDGFGAVRTLEQGFFADGEISPENPDICEFCVPPYNRHQRVQPGRIVVQEIDILQSLSLQGFSPPSQLRSITILAAGHAFESEVFDISLNAQE